MGALTSKQSAPPPSALKHAAAISDVDRAVLDLKNARDRLRRYRTKLEADEAKLVEQARKAKASGRTDRAIGLLRLRKYKQQQLQSVESQLLNVLTMVETIDSKVNEKGFLDAMVAGKDALSQLHKERTVDDVLELMDAVADEIAAEQEINDILQHVPTLSAQDEADVEQELEALIMSSAEQQQQQEQQQLPVAPSEGLLPAVPQKQLPVPVAQQQQQQPETSEQQQQQRVAVPG